MSTRTFGCTVTSRRVCFILICCVSLSKHVSSADDAKSASDECERLLGRVNLDLAPLAEVKALALAQKHEEAAKLLNEHFRKRFPLDSIKPRIINNVARDADEALNFRFRSRSSPDYFQLHRDFEWNRGPEGVKDHHWLSLLVSLDVLMFQADMFTKTGDEKYADGCARVFGDWLAHCPLGSGAPSWSLATTMMRAAVLMNVYQRMIHWQKWPAIDSARFLNAIVDHAEFMLSKRGPGNQDATNSEHLMRAASVFPEFRNSAKWFEAGFDRVKDRIFEDVLEDGAQKELCSGYHLNAINSYTNAALNLRSFGKDVSPEYWKRLEKMYEWCMVMIRPDGSVPTTGDSTGGNLREYLKQGSELFSRSDMAYVAASGASGTAPKFLDASLPAAGYYVMRSGWKSPDDIYLFMDISRQPVVSHQYFDALHLDLYAYGRDLFPAKGTFTYGGDAHAAAKATKNQTTITIDDKNQRDVPATCQSFFSSPELSFVDGRQEGYEGISHQRQVVFVRPIEGSVPYFIVVDRIEGKGAHTVDQNFHLPQGSVKIDKTNATASTEFSDGGNVMIVNLDSVGLETASIETEMHPRQGQSVKRPGVRFRRQGELPMNFVTLIVPYKGATLPVISGKMDRYSASAAGRPFVVHIELGDKRETVFLATEPVQISGNDNTGPARAALIRGTGEGKKRVVAP